MFNFGYWIGLALALIVTFVTISIMINFFQIDNAMYNILIGVVYGFFFPLIGNKLWEKSS